MRFKATDDQVRQIMANAINASLPFGMGFLQYKEREVLASEIKILEYEGRTVGADYYEGRMVKFGMVEKEPGVWEIERWGPTADYQSWVHKYPSFEALVASVLEVSLAAEVQHG